MQSNTRILVQCGHWTSHSLQGTRKKRPCITGQLSPFTVLGMRELCRMKKLQCNATAPRVKYEIGLSIYNTQCDAIVMTSVYTACKWY